MRVDVITSFYKVLLLEVLSHMFVIRQRPNLAK